MFEFDSNKDSENNIQLFHEKKDCCGCGACMNICPKSAISMKEDEYGFVYPDINYEKCTGCKACKKVCAYQNITESNFPQKVYVSSIKDDKLIGNSASGGIFAALATKVINDGGIVFGSTLEKQNGKLNPIHICADNLNDLVKLQGSKYVQSSINRTYKEAKQYLISGRKVLFSGTPCQIAGLNGFLGKKYDNLLAVDIICHGVPNAKFFQDYLKYLEEKLSISIINYKFRDKKKGWGLCGKIVYKDNSGNVNEKLMPCNLSSYYKMFLDSDIYRENCYTCKYACNSRPGDITIGDYWGVEKEHPELLNKIDKKKGISCIIINNNKGIEIIKQVETDLNLFESTFDKVSKRNGQLKHPSHYSKDRKNILNIYNNYGYQEVEKYYRKREGVNIYKYKIKNLVKSLIVGNS